MTSFQDIFLFILITLTFVLLFQVIEHHTYSFRDTILDTRESFNVISNTTDTYYLSEKMEQLTSIKDNLLGLRNDLYEKQSENILQLQTKSSDHEDEHHFSAEIEKTNTFENIVKISIPKGEKGDDGPEGASGEQGEQGDQGIRGEDGYCGAII